MTERVRGIAAVGMIVKTGLQDATKNVRIYGTISAASSPSTADAPRESLSRAPFPLPSFAISSPPPGSSSLPPFPYRRRFAKRTSVLTSSPRLVVARLRTLFPPLHVLFRHPHPIAPLRSEGGPHHTGRARTAGRDRPHCRGHHFNVTLIKSNNQYLPRKKF